MRKAICHWLPWFVSSVLFTQLQACSGGNEDPSADVATPLVNGTVVDEQTQEEFGLLTLNSQLGSCSASMLNDYWAITAAHCVENSTPEQVTLTSKWPSRYETATVTRIISYRPNDVALVSAGRYAFHRPSQPERTIFSARPSANLPIYAFGRGINVLARRVGSRTLPSSSDGAYRSGLFDISSINPNSELPPTSYSFSAKAGITTAGGDSGGPSYIQDWDDPSSPNRKLIWQLTGVHSTGSKTCLAGKTCEKEDPWTWVSAVKSTTDAAIFPLRDVILSAIQELPPDNDFQGQFDTRPRETTFIYAEQYNGDLMWSRGDNVAGQAAWQGPLQVGSGWNGLVDVTGAGGPRFYGRTSTGDLMWYEHTAFNDGAWDWKQTQVGWGWNAVSRMVGGGDGVIYAVMPNGDLRWYKHLGFETGAFDWAGPETVGWGWGGFKELFSMGDGVIYGIQPDGNLVWYRHNGFADGSFNWDGPVTVGWGWQNMIKVFSPGGGIIYALQPDGTLLRYKHLTWNAPVATFSWEGAQVLGKNWKGLRDIFTLAPMHAAGPR